MENQNLEKKSDCQCDDNCNCGDKCNCSSKTTIFTIILLVVIAILLASAGLYYFLQDKTPATNDLPQVTIEQPLNEESIINEPTIDEPTINEPTINEPTIEEDEQIENPPLNEAPTAIFYNNNNYGFALTLPSSWTGYITNERTLSWGDPIGDDNSIDFGFAAQDSIFNISIFTLEQWADLQNIEGPLPGYLGKNNQYVFAYDINQFTANAEMSARRTEVSGIISTFRLIP